MHPVHLVLAASRTALGPTTTVGLGVDVSGGADRLPGTQYLAGLASGIGFWGLIAAVVGIFVGGLLWAFGSYSQNYQQAYNGRKGVLVSGLAALLIGAGPYLVSFFFSRGGNIT